MRTEGATRLFPPRASGDRGPGTIDREAPFYNPAMALNRDLSVLLVEAFARQRGREVDVADALAGAGARAARLAHEVDAPLVVHANDADVAGIEALRRAGGENGIPARRLVLREGAAHAFLAARRFDVVDIDPYGSPAPFLDAAVRATRHDGLVCVTATDTAALAGAYPRVCRRRYGAEHRLHGVAWRSEVGLRVLAAALVQAGGRHDRAVEPVLSVARGHWMRIVARVRDGRAAADRAVAGLGWAWADEAHLGRTGRAGDVPAGAPSAGPLWTGALHERGLVEAMAAAVPSHRLATDAAPLLAVLAEEAEAPAFWADPGRLQGRFRAAAPRRSALIDALRAGGYRAARSHLDPQGVRTDADEAALRDRWTFAAKP